MRTLDESLHHCSLSIACTSLNEVYCHQFKKTVDKLSLMLQMVALLNKNSLYATEKVIDDDSYLHIKLNAIILLDNKFTVVFIRDDISC